MKISTIKSRILSIFLVSGAFISITFIISYYYFSKNEQALWDLNRKIDLSNHYLLRDVKVTRDFFSNETIRPGYYETGKSTYLDEHHNISANFVNLIEEISKRQKKNKYGLGEKMELLSKDYLLYYRNINSIIKMINLRGFKDYGVEGRMRYYAHKLEELSTRIGKEQVLSLRKHEKDFILRQDTSYKEKLHQQASELKDVIRDKNISKNSKELYISYIDSYQSKFDSLVYLDKLIGLKKQDGLKKEIDIQAEKIDKLLGTLYLSSYEKSLESLSHLKLFLGLILILLAIAGIILTSWISERISRSAIFLKEKMAEFIESDFSIKMALPLKESKYEIDILTHQFTILQQHIENQMMVLKHKNEELKKTFAELTNRFNDMMQFNYIVSHNLRAPVANLIGLSDMIIAGERSDDEKLQIIKFIQTSVLKIDNTIKDLSLILSYRNSANIEKENVRISELITNICGTLGIQIEDVNFNIEIPEGSDNIYTIKAYLESILYNLINNALKYKSPGRKLELSITVSKTEQNTIIMVKDNGIGIDLDKYGKDLFGLYKRFHLTVEGKGLGLHMCKTQIETLGGTIAVQSEPDKGSAFTITIPNN